MHRRIAQISISISFLTEKNGFPLGLVREWMNEWMKNIARRLNYDTTQTQKEKAIKNTTTHRVKISGSRQKIV